MAYLLTSLLWWSFLSSCIISAGYHRYFAHRAFKAPIWYEYLVLLFGPLSGSGPALGWVGVHRLHHNHSDTEKDPHSPRFISKWKVLTSMFDVPPIPRKAVKDLLKNKRVIWFYKHHKRIRWLSLFFFLIVFGPIWTFWLFIMPMVYGYIGYGLLNTFCHTKEKVRNLWWANILTGGEGWHANHHDNPRDWKIGKLWYEWDWGAWWIRLIKKS